MTAAKTPAATPLRHPLTWVAGIAQKAMRAGAIVKVPTVAEARDVKFFAIVEEDLPAGRMLRLDGLVFHSALAVSDVKQRRRGDEIVVEVRLTPVVGDGSGSFATEIPLSAGIHRVLFGRELVPIWQDTAQENPSPMSGRAG